MYPTNFARPTSLLEQPSLDEVVALNKEVARLRGLLATILEAIPEDQHAQRIRLLNALSELQIFERAFVDQAPRFADSIHDRARTQCGTGASASRRASSAAAPMFASLDKLKHRVHRVVEECDTLRHAFNTEQQRHQETLAETTVAWGELTNILDHEERKTAALTAERDELRATLWSQGRAAALEGSPRVRGKADQRAMALQGCEAAIARLEPERDALAAALEAQKDDTAGALRDAETRFATVQSERDALYQVLAQQKTDAERAARQAAKEHQQLAEDIQAAQANLDQLKAERDRLSSMLDTTNNNLASTRQGLDLSKKLVSHQNTVIENHVKKLGELESSLAVAGMLKTQVANEVKTLTERCDQLSKTLEITHAEKAFLEADLGEVQKQLAIDKSSVEGINAQLLAAQGDSKTLRVRLAEMENTLKTATASALAQESELVATRAERDRYAKREQDTIDALEVERYARVRIEGEHIALKAELNTVKTMLVNLSAAAHQSVSQERLHSPSRENIAVVFGSGSSVNIPKSSSMSGSKSSSRFGSPNKAAGGLNMS
ncbi:hypothetical protein PHLGIDRAFT_15184 [Phlebiopsis gigantea 11061_1 CR5-6]|uniref:Uncharacterized protein n=1 Tax=Phlebiopsis gigantea (strain 11061_1 CR5-6) TaxID=745531 RepID=A0A0C3S3L2_PHLG1|nr:hypothetical protein PHLGIDRAFT_15184 [Phlebiopsis gigantea 11061_1 CR5-6]